MDRTLIFACRYHLEAEEPATKAEEPRQEAQDGPNNAPRGPAPHSDPPSLVPQLALLRAISKPEPPFEALLDPDLDSKLASHGLDK